MSPKAPGKEPAPDASQPVEVLNSVAEPAPAAWPRTTASGKDYVVESEEIQKEIDLLWNASPVLGSVAFASAHVQSKALQYVHSKAGIKAGTEVTK
eukprot:gene5043-5151_t